MIVKAVLKSRLDEFLKKYEQEKGKTLDDVLQEGIQDISDVTPVRSGNLKEHNKGIIIDGEIYFYNDATYAQYVELGTYRIRAQYFMRKGINNLKSKLGTIFKKGLGE